MCDKRAKIFFKGQFQGTRNARYHYIFSLRNFKSDSVVEMCKYINGKQWKVKKQT